MKAINVADKLMKWRSLVSSYFSMSFTQQSIWTLIEEKDLLIADSTIFNVSAYISQIQQLKEVKTTLNGQDKISESKQNTGVLLKENCESQDIKNQKTVPQKPQKPEEPEPGDCCGSGCQVCVFDRYYQLLEEYEEKLMDWEEKYNNE